MKLREFNPQTVNVTTHDTPAFSVSLKTGIFNINKAACERMELKHGDSISFFQDEEAKENWYIEKVPRGKGFKLREKPAVSKGLLFNSVALARSLAHSVEFGGTSGRILIAGKPTIVDGRKLWGALVTNLNNRV